MESYVLSTYDDSLIGAGSPVNQGMFYEEATPETGRMLTVGVCRYAIEELLGWSPEEAVIKFNHTTAKLMKLDSLINDLDMPAGVCSTKEKYVLSLLYPSLVKRNEKQEIIDTYEAILDDNSSKGTFPRSYFVGSKGYKRFTLCLKHLIESRTMLDNAEDIYAFFSSPTGKEFLKKYRLLLPAYASSIDILDALRTVTRKLPDSEMLYSFYSFNRELARVK